MSTLFRTQRNVNLIREVVKNNRLIENRIETLENMGFDIDNVPMGSGGVLQEKKMKDGTSRIQISHGVGKYNYAYAVILS